MSRRTDVLEELLTPAVEAEQCRIWGIEYIPQSRSARLIVYIDSEDGVTLDDCQRVSHQISGVLDVEDPIRTRYTLEVSSPGLDRILFKPAQYAECIGEQVDVRLTVPVDGRRHWIGTLQEMSADEVLLESDGESVRVPLDDIHRARIVPRFD